MRVRVTVPVAFNGEHRVYEGDEFEIPNGTPIASWMELIDDTPTPVAAPRGRPKGKAGADAPANPSRVSDVSVG